MSVICQVSNLLPGTFEAYIYISASSAEEMILQTLCLIHSAVNLAFSP